MDVVTQYFNAERAESVFFIAVGLTAITAAAICFFIIKKPFSNGLASTLAVIAVLQLVVGITIHQRSPKDAQRVHLMIASAPDRIASEEVPRMQIVMRNFKVYLAVEVVLFLISLLVLVLVWAVPGGFWWGAAIGLALQSSLTAVLDVIATQRGAAYLDWLLLQTGDVFSKSLQH
jgi:hypothetical protein